MSASEPSGDEGAGGGVLHLASRDPSEALLDHVDRVGRPEQLGDVAFGQVDGHCASLGSS